jgi:hypothetical protein
VSAREVATNTPTVLVTLVSHTCGECGVAFGMPDYFLRQKQRDATSFHCPNGHSRVFRESEADKLRKQLAAQEEETRRQRERADRTDRQLVASRGQLTKIKNRVGNGVCPCCNRTFTNLQRHMGTKHPDYTKQDIG